MKKSISIYNQKRKSGHLTIELGISAILLIIITFFALDIGILIYSANFCDSAARDAARAAGDQSTTTGANNAIQAAVASHPVDGFFLKNLQATVTTYQPFSAGISAPALGNPGPFVTVRASVDARIPAPIPGFYAASTAEGGSYYTLRSQYTYPIVNTLQPIALTPGAMVGSTTSSGSGTTGSSSSSSTGSSTTGSGSSSSGTTGSTGSSSSSTSTGTGTSGSSSSTSSSTSSTSSSSSSTSSSSTTGSSGGSSSTSVGNTGGAGGG
jgi:Flp pilus assembly protein TadG